MGYRPSSVAPRGPWGIALDRLRQQRALSQSQAFELWGKGLGLGPRSRASYVALEHGKVPSPAQERYLRQELGLEPAEAVVETPVDGPDELVRALIAQTEAINALVARLDSLASGAIREGVADALREAGVGRVGARSPDELRGEQFA